jgi:hypothetical protein
MDLDMQLGHGYVARAWAGSMGMDMHYVLYIDMNIDIEMNMYTDIDCYWTDELCQFHTLTSSTTVKYKKISVPLKVILQQSLNNSTRLPVFTC